MSSLSFCTKGNYISKVKIQPLEQEKIIANEETDKGLISKIYKQLLQLNFRKINDPIKKWAKDPNRHFSKDSLEKTLILGKIEGRMKEKGMAEDEMVRWHHQLNGHEFG